LFFNVVNDQLSSICRRSFFFFFRVSISYSIDDVDSSI